MNKPPTPEYRPEKPKHLRTALKTVCLMLVYHAVSWILYIVLVGNNMNPDKISSQAAERLPWGLFWMGLIMLCVLGVVFVGFYVKDGERKRAYLAATSTEIRGAEHIAEGTSRYRKLAFVESLICALSAGALWLIPALFYTISVATSGRGYGYTDAWFFEEFFIGFIGLCEPFQNAWIGLALGMAVVFVFNCFGRLFAHKQWQENRIRR